MPGASNRTLRQMLSRGRVYLNGKPAKLAHDPVHQGDVLLIETAPVPATSLHGIEIVYEDEDLLVVRKPAGLLTVATLHERERTAYAYLRAYMKQRAPGGKLFIVHRLDRFVSGLLTFAKSEKVKERLQGLFHKHDIDRRYWAIVEGQIGKDRGTIESFLAEGTSGRMRSTRGGKGKRAVTHWRVLRKFPEVTTLEVTLQTGRKNQIRAHLAEMGHPIVGDRAYGSKTDPFGRIALHAFRLGFVHPTKATPLLFETAPPPEFVKYLPHPRNASVAVREGRTRQF